MDYWEKWRYKNLTFLVLSILLAIFISASQGFHEFLIGIGQFGYLGAFIAGALFVSTFTVAPAAIILLILAESIPAIEIGIIAGLGAVAGDLTIFNLVRNNLEKEIITLYDKVDSRHHFVKLLHTKYFSWTLPVIGALIIASPFPDEIGVSLMGISKMKTWQFLIISFILNAIGIFLVVSASRFIKP